MSRRSREECSQRCDVEIERRDVPESGKNQRHDVEIQRRYVLEKGQTDVATFQGSVKSMSHR